MTKSGKDIESKGRDFVAKLLVHDLLFSSSKILSGDFLQRTHELLSASIAAERGPDRVQGLYALLAVISDIVEPAMRAREKDIHRGVGKRGDAQGDAVRQIAMATHVLDLVEAGTTKVTAYKRTAERYGVPISTVRTACGTRRKRG